MQERDKRDKERASSPLIPAKDALIIDTSNLSIEEVFNKACKFISG
jgi:cytidylate kinase